MTGHAVSANGPKVLSVHDLGFRGFAIETASAVQPRTRTRFAFHSLNAVLFEAEAVSVHCFRLPGAGERWLSGWEFPEQPGLDAKIDAVIEEVVGILTIE